ncbi:MAG: NAD(P)/FAD-dependent oxidoreductase, partial [Chthoniobacterales bacterium]
QVSSFWRAGEAVTLDLLPQISGDDWMQGGRRSTQQLLEQHWPARFAAAWCARHASAKPLAQLSKRERKSLAELVHHWPILPNDTEGYPKAEVTVGGVATSELSSKTMEARKVPGLYFIGEVVDVTGWLGGYNFQWAWASGHAAGESA